MNQSVNGIRVYYANATINFDSNHSPIMTDDEYYQSGFKYSNSNMFTKMLQLLGAKINDNLYSITSNRLANADFLYTEKSLKFGIDAWTEFKYLDNTKVNFKMKVNSIGDVANITITMED